MKVPFFSNLGKRYLQIVLLFIAGFLGYGMRANLSVGIVAMLSKNPPDPSIPTYPEWTNKGVILSSFFWGYVLLQIIAGQIAQRYGPKWFFAGSFAVASLFCLLIPVMAASFGSTGVMISRFIQGLCQGFLFPSTHAILSKWTPLEERSRTGSFVYASGPLGTFAAMPITGLIADTKAGWPSAFYLFGTLGLIWTALFAWLGSNSPEEHDSVSEEEKLYIKGSAPINEKVIPPTPWKSLVTSVPVYAIIIGHIGNNWGYWTLLTEIPSYMDSVLKYDIKSNSLRSAVPYLGSFLLSLVLSPISDFLINRKILSIEWARKFFNGFGFYLPAIALIILGFVPSDQKNLAFALLIIAVATNAGNYIGFCVNHIDIAPNYAATLMGISNTFANVGSLIAPLVVQVIVVDEADETQWRIIFLIAAGFYVVSETLFIFMASGTIQAWNDPDEMNVQRTSKGVQA